MGRRRANATYAASHGVDESTGLSYAMDMSPLMKEESGDPLAFTQEFIRRFSQEVSDRLRRMS